MQGVKNIVPCTKGLQKIKRKGRQALKLQAAWATLSCPPSPGAREQSTAAIVAVHAIAKAASGPPPQEAEASLPQLVRLLQGLGLEAEANSRAVACARRDAARVLEWCGRKASAYAADIASVLDDADIAIKCWALRALARIGKEAESQSSKVERALHDRDRAVHCLAIGALARMGEAAEELVSVHFGNVIDALLWDNDVEVRRAAAFTVLQRGKRASTHVADVAEALGDADAHVRRLMANSLYCMGRRSAGHVKELAKALKDSDVVVRRWAARALERLAWHLDDIRGELANVAVHDPDVSVRKWVLLALGRLGAGMMAWGDDLASALNDPEESVRCLAIAVFGQFGGEFSWVQKVHGAFLVEALKSQAVEVKRSALLAVGMLGNDFLAPRKGALCAALREALLDKDVLVRRGAAQALTCCRDDASFPRKELEVVCKKDSDKLVCAWAKHALCLPPPVKHQRRHSSCQISEAVSCREFAVDEEARSPTDERTAGINSTSAQLGLRFSQRSDASEDLFDDVEKAAQVRRISFPLDGTASCSSSMSGSNAAARVSNAIRLDSGLSKDGGSGALRRGLSNLSGGFTSSSASSRIRRVTSLLRRHTKQFSEHAHKLTQKRISFDGFSEGVQAWLSRMTGETEDLSSHQEEGQRYVRNRERRGATPIHIVPTTTGAVFAKREQTRRETETNDNIEDAMGALVVACLLVMGMNTGSLLAEINVMFVFLRQGSWGYIYIGLLGFPIWFKSMSSFGRDRLNRRSLGLAWQTLRDRKMTVEQVKHGHKCASRLWADSGLAILSPCPALLVTVFALCADPKFDAPDLRFERAKMFICMLISSCVCGKNLNMHDMAFITWTGHSSTSHFHLLMRISEVLLRITTTGVTVDLLTAAVPHGKDFSPFCVAFYLSLEVFSWFVLLKRQLAGFSTFTKIDALGAAFVLTFVNPFYFGSEWKHLNFKDASRVYSFRRLLQPPLILILCFTAQYYGLDVNKSMLPLFVIVLVCSWFAFALSAVIVTARRDTYGIILKSEGHHIHLAKSIVQCFRACNFFQSVCPARVVEFLRQLHHEHAHHHAHHHHHRRNSARLSMVSTGSLTGGGAFERLISPLIDPTPDDESELNSSSEEDSSSGSGTSGSGNSESSESSKSESEESEDDDEQESDNDEDQQQSRRESMKSDADTTAIVQVESDDSEEDVASSGKEKKEIDGSEVAFGTEVLQTKTKDDLQTSKKLEIDKAAGGPSAAAVNKDIVLALNARRLDFSVAPSMCVDADSRTSIDASLESDPPGGSKRGDGTVKAVRGIS